jgi:hypothetical protein
MSIPSRLGTNGAALGVAGVAGAGDCVASSFFSRMMRTPRRKTKKLATPSGSLNTTYSPGCGPRASL